MEKLLKLEPVCLMWQMCKTTSKTLFTNLDENLRLSISTKLVLWAFDELHKKVFFQFFQTSTSSLEPTRPAPPPPGQTAPPSGDAAPIAPPRPPEDTPPELPPRNRPSLVSLHPPAVATPSSTSTVQPTNVGSSYEDTPPPDIPPPPPPRPQPLRASPSRPPVAPPSRSSPVASLSPTRRPGGVAGAAPPIPVLQARAKSPRSPDKSERKSPKRSKAGKTVRQKFNLLRYHTLQTFLDNSFTHIEQWIRVMIIVQCFINVLIHLGRYSRTQLSFYPPWKGFLKVCKQ